MDAFSMSLNDRYTMKRGSDIVSAFRTLLLDTN